MTNTTEKHELRFLSAIKHYFLGFMTAVLLGSLALNIYLAKNPPWLDFQVQGLATKLEDK